MEAQYELGEVLGSGSYGSVHRATVRETGQVVAIKKLRLDSSDEGIPATLLREITALKDLSHENVVDLYDVILLGPREISLVFEYAEMDLKQYMRQREREHGSQALPPNFVKALLFQLLRGMAFIHGKRYLHRDLKPQNLLIVRPDGDLSGIPLLKIADFGLSRSTTIPVRKFVDKVVTLWYRAPELLLGDTRYTSAVDVWSVGAIFAEICNGQAFLSVGRNEQEEAEVRAIVRRFGKPAPGEWPAAETLKNRQFLASAPDPGPNEGLPGLAAAIPSMSADGIDLLRRMMRWNPEDRITCADAMLHPYFSDLPPEFRGAEEAHPPGLM